MNIYKKIILLLFILTVISGSVFAYVVFSMRHDQEQKITKANKAYEDELVKMITEWEEARKAHAAREEEMNRPKEWKTYVDKNYGFEIDYEDNLIVKPILNPEDTWGNLTRSGGVSFVYPNLDGLGAYSVSVYERTDFNSPQDWLDYRSEHRASTYVKEKDIIIDGQKAIVVYPVSMFEGEIYEEFKYEKSTAFMKDNKLYIIYVRSFQDDSGYERLWNSFKFTK